MQDHKVFESIWDPKKTHLQLVQRSDEVFKLLVKEDKMTLELLDQFWSLSKSDYKSEIFKILSDTYFYLKQTHIEFIFKQITATPADKLSITEFDCLCDLGKRCQSSDF